jgi:hypothetical protein
VSLVHNERTKLTATYLNTAAGGMFTAGVIAPLAAAAFGVSGAAGHLSTSTLALGVLISLCASIALHAAARYVVLQARAAPE